MTVTKKALRIGAMTAAAFFLFNPNINLLDLLPDCIGFLLLWYGLGELGERTPHLAAAKSGFLRLALITLTKIPAYFIMAALVGDNQSQRTTVTLFAFAYMLIELIFTLPVLREFFAGIDYLRERHGALEDAAHLTENCKQATYVWLTAKPILAFLPELCYLSDYEHYGYINGGVDILLYRPMFIAIALLVGFCIGIYFLTAAVRFFGALRRDTVTVDLLSTWQAERKSETAGRTRIRRIRLALGLMVAGAGCLIDLYFDKINYLPNAVGILFFMMAAALLLQFSRRALWPLIAGLVALPLSLAAYILRAHFFTEHSYGALGRLPAADRLYDTCQLFATLEGAMLLCMLVGLAFLLFDIIGRETGYAAENAYNAVSHTALHRTLRIRAAVMCAIGGLGVVAQVADLYLRRVTESLKQGTVIEDFIVSNGQVVLPVFGWFWLISLMLATLFLLSAFHFATTLGDEVEHKYMLE